MNAVASNDDVALDNRAIGERNAGYVVILCEARATVAGVHHPGAQCARKQFDKVSAMPSTLLSIAFCTTWTGAIGVPSWRK